MTTIFTTKPLQTRAEWEEQGFTVPHYEKPVDHDGLGRARFTGDQVTPLQLWSAL